MKPIVFEASQYGMIKYQHYNGAVYVEIDGYWFSREKWDELTAALFFPQIYVVDADVWLP